MRKHTVVRVFVGSLLVGLCGLVMLTVSGIVLYRSDTFVMEGPDVVGIEGTALGWTMLGLATLASLVVAGAVIGQLVAWVGAVVNTAALHDKTWMVVLLVTGLLSFGFVGMLAYVLAGPDDAATWPEPAAEQESHRMLTTAR